jgi:hypothetical protein
MTVDDVDHVNANVAVAHADNRLTLQYFKDFRKPEDRNLLHAMAPHN